MKFFVLAVVALAEGVVVSPAFTQSRAWRCGAEYTNDAASARRPDCRLVGGPLPARASARQDARPDIPLGTPAPAPARHSTRVDGAQQRQRDAEIRFVLLEELKKAEIRHAELLAQGKPDGREKAAELVRNESDIAALRRELSRLPAAP